MRLLDKEVNKAMQRRTSSGARVLGPLDNAPAPAPAVAGGRRGSVGGTRRASVGGRRMSGNTSGGGAVGGGMGAMVEQMATAVRRFSRTAEPAPMRPPTSQVV